MQDLLSGLNDEQKKAVLQIEGPLLIQAGAGSGKTKTLTHRVARILSEGKAHPQQILAVTFTNKAAKEMRERVARLLGEQAENRAFLPYMGTFHGICVRLLRQDGEHIGIPKSFVIYDESDRLAAIKQISKRSLSVLSNRGEINIMAKVGRYGISQYKTGIALATPAGVETKFHHPGRPSAPQPVPHIKYNKLRTRQNHLTLPHSST